MDRFGIGKVGLPRFGVGEFRLPVFGGSGRGSGGQGIPKPDAYYDLSLKDNSSPTRNIMDDLSGNRHDAEIFNAAYALGSGYGKYTVDFNSWRKENTNINVTSSSITITGVLQSQMIVHYGDGISKEWKVQITGLPASKSIFYRYYEDGDTYKQYEINKNGVYLLPPSIKTSGNTGFICSSNDMDKLTNLTITQIPDYQGAFVFDGIDDYAVMQDEKKGFKTLFMEVVPFNLNKIIYDQRDTTNNFAIFNEPNSVAYNARNNGVTYINGKLNQTIISNNLIDKRQIITIVNGNVGNVTHNITIGSSPLHNEHFSNMALYKLIGFYDELTPLQIEKVIQKYNLKFDE